MTTQTTITRIAIHQSGSSPVHGENTIMVELDDEGAGPFIVLHQPLASVAMGNEYAGKVAIDFQTEWPAVKAAVNRMMNQPGVIEGGAQ